MEPLDPISRLNAALQGRYRVERELGEGGTATVYLARDLRHHRDVALKVLNPDLAALLGADRFLAEIRTTAILQHPHILPLFDSGEADGLLFYVMPHVDGESLRERLERERQLPVDDAVRITSAVAEALDHAHRHGVVHRDIKPGNILLRDGQPLVADFGIALAVDAAEGHRLTGTGLTPGTPQYMSPEQATGDRVIGPATDIYSLGCVLYECLAGRPPYTGTSPQAILGRIVTSTPAGVREHRESVPPHVEAAVARALEKLPADRFQSAAEFGRALSDPAFRHRPPPGGPPQRTDRWKAVSAVLGVLTLALLGWMFGSDDTDLRYYNLNLPLGTSAAGEFPSRVALSPDGTRYVHVAPGPGLEGGGLWVREAARPASEPLSALSGARNPVFSPDGQRLAALQLLPAGRSALLTARLDGTGAVNLAEGELDRMGHSWGDDGYIYIGSATGVLRIPEGGGEFEQVTRIDRGAGETGHHGPVILPGGEAVVFTVRYEPFGQESLYQIGVAPIGEGAHRILTPGVRADYAPPGVLLHVSSEGQLLATPFDRESLELTGATTPIADDVYVGRLGAVDLTVSGTGTLVYGAALESAGRSELMRVSRDGSARSLAPGWTEAFSALSVSPDGSRLAVSVGAENAARADIWVWSFDRGTRLPLTSQALNIRPAWTPAGDRVGFVSDRGGASAAWTVRPDGSGEPERVLGREEDIAEAVWSLDGRWLLYRMSFQEGSRGDVVSVDLESGTERRLLETESGHATPALSPDPRWIAYASFATGGPEVWVASFPDVQQSRHQISQGGGTQPRWSSDGRELYFRNGDDDLVVVEVADGSEFSFTSPRRLFSVAPYRGSSFSFTYDVLPDGDGFVMIRGAAEEKASELVVIEGFLELLDR